MGFVKKDLETIADALADRRQIAHAAFFASTESVPAIRPG
jgi:hypothetical protein